MKGFIESVFGRIRETVTGSKSSSSHGKQPAGQSASLDGEPPTKETVSAGMSPRRAFSPKEITKSLRMPLLSLAPRFPKKCLSEPRRWIAEC